MLMVTQLFEVQWTETGLGCEASEHCQEVLACKYTYGHHFRPEILPAAPKTASGWLSGTSVSASLFNSTFAYRSELPLHFNPFQFICLRFIEARLSRCLVMPAGFLPNIQDQMA